MNKLLRVFLAACLTVLCAGAQPRIVRFKGEVSDGGRFQKAIGSGLVFSLEPVTYGSGWNIRIGREGQRAPECDGDFVVVAPLRGYNDADLDTADGITAKQAVGISPRDFKFLLNCAGYKEMTEVMTAWFEPDTLPEAKAKEANDGLHSEVLGLGFIPKGTGRLWIRDSRIVPG